MGNCVGADFTADRVAVDCDQSTGRSDALRAPGTTRYSGIGNSSPVTLNQGLLGASYSRRENVVFKTVANGTPCERRVIHGASDSECIGRLGLTGQECDDILEEYPMKSHPSPRL